MYSAAVVQPTLADTFHAPPFLALASHPIRWRLLVELGRSDLHVEDLTRLVGQPQNLVSYHLGQLRNGGLVSSKRSSRDARTTYYRAELGQYQEALGATARALHPALGRVSVESPSTTKKRSSKRQPRPRVLFLCTGNSARSQVAEALLRHVAGDRVTAYSAGSDPKPIHPLALTVLAEIGIDIAEQRPQNLSMFIETEFAVVVTLCDKVRERCPEFPGDGERIHWSLDDPSAGTESDGLERFQRMRDELHNRVTHLVSMIDALQTQGAHP